MQSKLHTASARENVERSFSACSNKS